MASTKVTPILLAGSVALAGTLSLVTGILSPALAASDTYVVGRTVDTRVTSVDDLTDVNQGHWAYDALRDLVEKYDVIEGYPDKTFKGNRFATRWEMAAALNDLIKAVGRDLARLGAEKANRADLETLARLQDEFKNELAALDARTGALETRATAIEAKNEEQDARLTLLEKTQVHGDISVGVLSTLARSPQLANGQSGPQDALQAIARLRLALDVPVYEGDENDYLGEGRVRTRLIAAYGNNGAQGGFNGLSRIAADRSVYNEGLNTGALNATNRANVYVERMYYEQDLKPGIPVLTNLGLAALTGDDSDSWKAKGTLFGGVYPFRDFFDKSAYRGNELTQFQNTAFVNIPGLPTNLNFVGVGYAMKQNLGDRASLNLTAATGSPNTNDTLQLWNVMYEAKLNYLFDLLGEELTGALYAGGFHTFNHGGTGYTFNGNNINQRNGNPYPAGTFNNDNALGVYAGWDQEIFKGIGFNVGYMYNKVSSNATVLNSLNPINGSFNLATGTNGSIVGVTPKQSITAAFKFPMEALFPGFRDGDHFGVGYALVDFNDINTNIGGDDRFEQVMETYYTFYLNDQISFVPSFQLAQNRLGLQSNDVSMAIGFRTNVRF